mmetsp:Transcript_104217/g.293901  ORF Transcript_104217/g.293901 Transcript_104217/m.293901 type:complete len:281 (+) Transcript_104217:67-909(+)
MPLTVSMLLADAHFRALQLLAAHGGAHHQGLAQATRAHRHLLPKWLAKRLLHLDIAFGVARHVSSASVDSLLHELRLALDAAPQSHAHHDYAVQSDESTCDAAASCPSASDSCPVMDITPTDHIEYLPSPVPLLGEDFLRHCETSDAMLANLDAASRALARSCLAPAIDISQGMDDIEYGKSSVSFDEDLFSGHALVCSVPKLTIGYSQSLGDFETGKIFVSDVSPPLAIGNNQDLGGVVFGGSSSSSLDGDLASLCEAAFDKCRVGIPRALAADDSLLR